MSAKRKRGATPARSWVSMREVGMNAELEARLRETGWDPSTVRVWLNDRYQCFARPVGFVEGFGPMVHLSIKRHDKNVVRDWRHLQQIKNDVVGNECEGVELYPAESRLVDEANQFHLWVIADRSVRLPFGHEERLVGSPAEAAEVGARQRPFEDAS